MASNEGSHVDVARYMDHLVIFAGPMPREIFMPYHILIQIMLYLFLSRKHLLLENIIHLYINK